MANEFNKEEQVAFEDLVMGFDDEVVLSKTVEKYTGQSKVDGQRTAVGSYLSEIWRPMPMIATSVNGAPGTDISASFEDVVSLAVPSRLAYNKTVPWTFNIAELRDPLQLQRFTDAAKQRLATDVNLILSQIACRQGTLVVKRTGSASYGFADIAACETIMNSQGVKKGNRFIGLNTGDYNLMADNLAGRETLQPPKTLTAYEEAAVGKIASFNTLKLDYTDAFSANAATSVSVNGASQYHTPASVDLSGAPPMNVDNRTMSLTVTATGTIAAGACFTIAGVYAVNHITKQSTGALKTFRVITGRSGSGAIVISPPIISAGGATDAELAYQNVSATPADTAVITFLNTAAGNHNPFWVKDAIEIIPGSMEYDTGAGMGFMKATTPFGFEIAIAKQYAIGTNKVFYRADICFGATMLNPEMAGTLLLTQS